MRALSDVLGKKMLPHFFAILQLVFLVVYVMPFANFPIIVTGRKANDALKVIMPFHLWVLILSITLFALFYRIRKEGLEERGIIIVSLLTILFSAIHLALQFVDNFLLVMWATGNIAATLYLTAATISLYKISAIFLVPILARAWKIRQRSSKLSR